MANLTVVAADVAAIEVIEQDTGPAGEALTAGAYVIQNTSTGKWMLGAGDSAGVGRNGGICIKDAIAGQTTTVVRKGTLNMGAALDGATYDDDVYLSDAVSTVEGLLTLTSSESTITKIIGTVVPLWGTTTPAKGLRVDL